MDATNKSTKEIRWMIYEEWIAFHDYRARKEIEYLNYLINGKC